MDKKTQAFEDCASHGYEWDSSIGDYDRSKPLCFRTEVKQLGLFEVFYPCSRGTAVRIDDIEYCATCKFSGNQTI